MAFITTGRMFLVACLTIVGLFPLLNASPARGAKAPVGAEEIISLSLEQAVTLLNELTPFQINLECSGDWWIHRVSIPMTSNDVNFVVHEKHLRDTSPRFVESVLKQFPDYELLHSEKVYTLVPRRPARDPLAEVIARFQVNHSNAFMGLRSLCEAVPFSLDVIYPVSIDRHSGPDLTRGAPHWPTDGLRSVSLNLTNVIVRDILNRLVSPAGKGYWITRLAEPSENPHFTNGLPPIELYLHSTREMQFMQIINLGRYGPNELVPPGVTRVDLESAVATLNEWTRFQINLECANFEPSERISLPVTLRTINRLTNASCEFVESILRQLSGYVVVRAGNVFTLIPKNSVRTHHDPFDQVVAEFHVEHTNLLSALYTLCKTVPFKLEVTAPLVITGDEPPDMTWLDGHWLKQGVPSVSVITTNTTVRQVLNALVNSSDKAYWVARPVVVSDAPSTDSRAEIALEVHNSRESRSAIAFPASN